MEAQTKSLKARKSDLADVFHQLEVISHIPNNEFNNITFSSKLSESGLLPLKPTQLEIFQINVGKMCNQVCKHCHVDAGPDRKEIMTKETMELCLEAIENSKELTIDLTGGAPEMNPNFRWFVEEINKLNVKKIIVRSNLTIIVSNKKYFDLPNFFKSNNIKLK